MTGLGPATDFLLQTRHSTRRSRDRRHSANHDPQLTVANDG